MKCHYEVLEVNRDADFDTIKASYRRLALIWHPDKNTDRVEECTKHFTLLQQAWEVLSDRQERAWYDRHRDQILRGGVDEHYKDNSLNLFPYFSSSCYSGFKDDEKGFYAVYKHVFETLSKEDLDFVDDPDECSYPSFGSSESNYEEIVGTFYGFWSSYCTKRTFSWLDKYDIREKVNRATMRAMEKENMKLRDAGRKERNEEIRELVSYVRKRDPRVAAQRKVLEQKRLEQQQKTEEQRKAQIRQRLAELSIHVEDEETREKRENDLQAIEERLAAEFGASSGEEEDPTAESSTQGHYCIVCEKNFKNPQQLVNHKKSNKHRIALNELKQHLKDDDAGLLEDGDDERESESSAAKRTTKSKRQRRKHRKSVSDEEDADDEAATTADDERLEMKVPEAPENSNESQEATVNGTQSNETNKVPIGEQCYLCSVDVEGKKLKTRPQVATQPAHVDETNESRPKTGRCDMCKMVFESRTQLFIHLRESGHATIKGQPPIVKAGGKNQRKKK